jgi:hypothetical protein
MAAMALISESKEGRQPESSHTMCLPSAFNCVQVSLTLEESHLRTSSAGGCGADTSPTYRRAPAGAFERCAGDSPRWRVRARPPKTVTLSRAFLSFRTTSRRSAAGAESYSERRRRESKGPGAIIPPRPPAVKSFREARLARIVKLILYYLDYIRSQEVRWTELWH